MSQAQHFLHQMSSLCQFVANNLFLEVPGKYRNVFPACIHCFQRMSISSACMYTIGLLNKVGGSTGKYLSQVSSGWTVLPSQVWKFWLHKQAGVAKYNSKCHFADNFCFNFIQHICRFTWNGWTFHSHTSTPTYLWLSLSSSTWNVI